MRAARVQTSGRRTGGAIITCIVGLVESDKRVWIGGDGAGFINGTMLPHKEPKVFRKGEFLIGAAGQARFSDITRYAFEPPEIDKELGAYMALDFVNALRTVLKDGGFLCEKDGRETIDDCQLLIGVRGELFHMDDCFSVSAIRHGVFAAGAGMDYALGALFASRDYPANERVMLALRAAEFYCDSVAAPFHLESV